MARYKAPKAEGLAQLPMNSGDSVVRGFQPQLRFARITQGVARGL